MTGKKEKIPFIWINVILTMSLVIVILFANDVPQNIQTGLDAHTASKLLHDLRHHLLKTRAESLPVNKDGSEHEIHHEIAKLCGKAISCDDFAKASSYSNVLSAIVVDFKTAFHSWVNTINGYEQQLAQPSNRSFSHPGDSDLMRRMNENNALFFQMMSLLEEGDDLVNHDIDNGYQALKILQLAVAFVLFYFFTNIVLLQRSSNRKHIIREKNLEITLKSIADAVIATDIHGKITCMNPEAERLTGWDFEKAKGHALSEVFRVVSEHSGKPVGDLVERVKDEGNVVILAEDSMLLASNGSRYQIYENGAPIYDDSGMIIGVVLVFRDITHAHELKGRLNENTNRLQRIIDSSMDCVISSDEFGMVKEWNPAAELMFGWSYEEACKRPIHETIIPEEYREQHLLGIERFINSAHTSIHTKRIESEGLHRDGHKFPIELAMTSIRTERGWLFNAFIRDLSDIKQNENTIKKNDALLRKAQRLAKFGFWELDLVNDTLEWSDEIFRIFMLDPDTVEPSYEVFINTVHSEDRERVDAAYWLSINNRTPYNIIHRICTSEGVKVVHESCETTFSDDGIPLRSLGVVQDITESTENLNELRLAETMFSVQAGIVVTATDGTIIRVNPAYEEVTGYSAKELIGKNPRILQSGKQSNQFYIDMWNQVANDGSWQGELWNKRKDGSLYAEWLSITAVNNDEGEITHYVGAAQDITERKHAESRIEYLAYHDDLTDLANRRLLHDRLHQYIAACKRHKEYGAVLLMDLDHFKDLNDSLGHSVGDEILRQVASRLKEMVRESDTVARLGGDEFVVVLTALADNISKAGLKVQAIAEKIQQRLSQPYRLRDGECYSNISIGVSIFPEESEDIDDILKHADTALYRAKEQGRNTVCFYQPSMQVEVDERLAIGDGLRHALNNNEFILYYQPQVNETGELIGAEALLRWLHPQKGLISPDKFISVAEDTGLIVAIGQWVMQEVARQVLEWKTGGMCKDRQIRLAINVSTRQFRQPDFVSQVLSTFKQAAICLDCIELEVTESLLMDERDEIVEKMKSLRSHGIRISIDDFGTGYSSLAYLRKLPLDQLKIDRSFIRDITANGNDMVVVETIIAMSSHLGLSVIAEGVENKQQLDSLIEKGCNAFQGYYFSKPLNAEDFTCYIREEISNCLPCQSQ